MIRKTLWIPIALLAVVASAAEVPKEWKTRYNSLLKTMRSKDLNSFEKSFADGFVCVDDKGKETSRDEFVKMVEGMFADAGKVTASVKLGDVKATGDTADVTFDFHLHIKHVKGGSTDIHEVGTDSWKKDGGTWMVVKTVDKSMTMKEAKPRKGKGGTPPPSSGSGYGG